MKNYLIFLCMALLPGQILAQDHANLLIGTYTKKGTSKGIYVYDFNLRTGDTYLKSEVAIPNPSFLTLSPDKRFVYSVSEEDGERAAANAFAYDRDTCKLRYLDSLQTGGGSPCHITTDPQNRHVIVSNYTGGNLSVFSTAADGSLDRRVQLFQFNEREGGDVQQRQSHIHSATFSPDGKFVLVQDLGADLIRVYEYHGEDKENPLRPAKTPSVACSPGGGPRHITFSADGRFVYLVQEMGARVQVFAYKDGMLRSIQEISMLSKGFEGKVGAADIHLSPDGKFLYASNRLDADDICIYKVDAQTGLLSYVANQPTLGRHPRNFTITADGRLLLVANQDTDEVVIFIRDADTGRLSDSGKRIHLGAPVCLVLDYND